MVQAPEAAGCGALQGEALCRCKGAVTRAYAGMLDSGAGPAIALEAAVRVYRYHHPSAPPDFAQLTVECWVFHGRLH